MRKASLKDIAESLGVSIALVSLVLNGKGDERGIKKETQEKVKAKAKELNYTPNPTAVSLKLGRTNTIGLIIPDVSNEFYAKLCKFIELKASELGYDIIITNSYEDSEKEYQLIHKLIQKNVDGLIIASSFETPSELRFLKEKNFPVVLVDRIFDNFPVDSVSVNNIDGAKTSVEYFNKKGIKKTACLTISPTYISSISERVKGYLNELDDMSQAKLIQIPHNDIPFSVQNAIKQIKKDNIKGVFCTNNSIAKSFLKQMSMSKTELDIEIVSFDDSEVFDFAQPKIASIEQPISQMGKVTVELLDKYIKDKDKHIKQKIVLDTKLIER